MAFLRAQAARLATCLRQGTSITGAPSEVQSFVGLLPDPAEVICPIKPDGVRALHSTRMATSHPTASVDSGSDHVQQQWHAALKYAVGSTNVAAGDAAMRELLKVRPQPTSSAMHTALPRQTEALMSSISHAPLGPLTAW